MAERDRQVEREVDPEFDSDLDADLGVDLPRESATDRASEASRGDKVRTRVREGAGSVFSGRALAISLVLALASVVFLGGVLPLGVIGDLFAILVAGFLYGVVAPTGRYAELGLAGGVVGGGSALFGNVVLSLLGPGIPLVFFGLVAGGISGVLGHYFGRDLRDGLTREI